MPNRISQLSLNEIFELGGVTAEISEELERVRREMRDFVRQLAKISGSERPK